MLEAVLFDLDGTLLHMDTDEFTTEYIRALAPHLEHVVAPHIFAKQLMASTYEMIKNTDPSRTNQEIFIADFFARIGQPVESLMPIFDDFYRHDFAKLKRLTRPNPWAQSVVDQAIRNGWRVVIATNPVFPLEAIAERLRWAGIDQYSYDLITSYEVMHYCKPQPAYYQEILRKLQLKPEQCLMVGNDVDEDLVAGCLGIKTFLAEECVINRRGEPPKADYVGSFCDLIDLLDRIRSHGE
ncbi:MAG: HAD family hydrolase [Bacillota bacterium]